MRIFTVLIGVTAVLSMPISLAAEKVGAISKHLESAGEMGVEFGTGSTKKEAYDNAKRNLKSGAHIQSTTYTEESDGSWKCSITWTKD